MRHTWSVTLVALLATLILAGCSGDDPPPVASPRPPTTTHSTTSPSSSASATPQEEEALPTTPRAFLREWFVWADELKRTGDSVMFRRTASRICDGCTRNIRFFSRLHRDGGWVKGGEFTMVRARHLGDTAERQTWLVDTHSTPTRYKESAEGPIKTLDGGDMVMRFALEPKGRSFELVGLYQEAT